MNKNERLSRLIFILLIALMISVWAFAFPFIRISLRELSFINLTILRFFVVCIAFSVVLLLKPKSFSKLNKKDIPVIFLLGFIGVITYHLCLNYGEQFVSASVASLIVATIPIFVLIFAAIFLKERISSIKFLGIMVALCGVVILTVWGKEDTSLEIDYLLAAIAILFASIAGSFYTVLGKKLLSRYNALSLTVYAMVLGSLGLIPFINVSLFEEVSRISLITLGAVIFLGLFSTVIGYFLWYCALEIKTASELSVYLYATPVLSTIISYFLLGEGITLMFIIGGLLVIIGLVIVNKDERKKLIN